MSPRLSPQRYHGPVAVATAMPYAQQYDVDATVSACPVAFATPPRHCYRDSAVMPSSTQLATALQGLTTAGVIRDLLDRPLALVAPSGTFGRKETTRMGHPHDEMFVSREIS